MQIRYQNIILRDSEKRDIEDEIRWSTVETQWALWDAPWEMEEELAQFDPEEYRREALRGIAIPPRGIRWQFEIDTAQGVHIGGVNAYLTDEHFRYVSPQDALPLHPLWVTVGIEIEESSCWGHGYGTQALAAFIRYHLAMGHRNIATQTWSGNERMIRTAYKLGFRLCKREEGVRKVRGGVYDAVSFCLDTAVFEARYGTMAEDRDTLLLIEPDEGHEMQVMHFREMLLAREERFHGCAGLKEVSTYAEWLKHGKLMKKPLGENALPSTVYLALRPSDGEVVGILHVGHALNDFGLHLGGNIGCTVRPDMRRRGYGVRMLALSLDKCRERGAKRVLVCCDKGNEAFRRAIVRCGGVLENEGTDDVGLDQSGVIQRYWVDTAHP